MSVTISYRPSVRSQPGLDSNCLGSCKDQGIGLAGPIIKAKKKSRAISVPADTDNLSDSEECVEKLSRGVVKPRGNTLRRESRF